LISQNTQSALYISYIFQGCGPRGQTISFCWVDENFSIMIFDAEILDVILFKMAFRRFKEKGKFSSVIKDFMCNDAEFCEIITTKEDIIHIDQYSSWVFVNKIGKRIIHKALECCGRIT
jgi:hypothetical protein